MVSISAYKKLLIVAVLLLAANSTVMSTDDSTSMPSLKEITFCNILQDIFSGKRNFDEIKDKLPEDLSNALRKFDIIDDNLDSFVLTLKLYSNSYSELASYCSSSRELIDEIVDKVNAHYLNAKNEYEYKNNKQILSKPTVRRSLEIVLNNTIKELLLANISSDKYTRLLKQINIIKDTNLITQINPDLYIRILNSADQNIQALAQSFNPKI